MKQMFEFDGLHYCGFSTFRVLYCRSCSHQGGVFFLVGMYHRQLLELFFYTWEYLYFFFYRHKKTHEANHN